MTLIARPDSQLLVVDANVGRLEATRAALAPVGASVLGVTSVPQAMAVVRLSPDAPEPDWAKGAPLASVSRTGRLAGACFLTLLICHKKPPVLNIIFCSNPN